MVAHRDGPDGSPSTGDDDLFNTLAELDGVAGVGPSAMESLYRCAAAFDYLVADRDGLLAFVNDPYLATFDRLDGECGLRSDSARNIVAHRDGQDGRHGTGDDDPFNDLQELDSLPMVGLDTIGALYTCAERVGVVVDWTPPGTTQVLVVPSLEALDGALREVVLEDLWFRARNMSGAVSPEDVSFSKAEIYYSGTKVAGYMVEFDALQIKEGLDDGTASHFVKVSFLLDDYFRVTATHLSEGSGTVTP
ncbi:MAG: hypothetical protein D6806_00735 [Deltaproteobacteria bacterium]|nr:MAG: hypothetical protein D6806_00735 [Deltaproteobacteria bacterium]